MRRFSHWIGNFISIPPKAHPAVLNAPSSLLNPYMQAQHLVKLPKPWVIVISEEAAEWCFERGEEGGGERAGLKKEEAVMAMALAMQDLEARWKQGGVLRIDGWGGGVKCSHGGGEPFLLPVAASLLAVWSPLKQLPFHLDKLIAESLWSPPPHCHHCSLDGKTLKGRVADKSMNTQGVQTTSQRIQNMN